MQGNYTHPLIGYEYKTPNEYCAAARISRATFWRLVRNNQIPVVKFGERCTRVPVQQEPKVEAA